MSATPPTPLCLCVCALLFLQNFALEREGIAVGTCRVCRFEVVCIAVESERGSGSKSFFSKEIIIIIIIIIMATTVMAGAATISAFLGGGRLSSSSASSNSSGSSNNSNNNSPSCSMTQLAAVSPARALTTPCSLLVSTPTFCFPKMGDLNFDVFLLYLCHYMKGSHFSLQMYSFFSTRLIAFRKDFASKGSEICMGVLVTCLLVVSGVIILSLEKISCGGVVL